MLGMTTLLFALACLACLTFIAWHWINSQRPVIQRPADPARDEAPDPTWAHDPAPAPPTITAEPVWHAPLKSFAQIIGGSVGAAIKAMMEAKWDRDPLLTIEQSRDHSIVSSAIIRHGQLIEEALRDSLCACDRYEIWTEPAFAISFASDQAFRSATEQGCLSIELPYGDGDKPSRVVQVDIIAYDRQTHTVRQYAVKRGVGGISQQKTVKHDLLCVHMLLKSWATYKGFQPVKVESYLISYYGASWAYGWCLHAKDLDQHFGYPIRVQIETATAAFKEKLQGLLAQKPHRAPVAEAAPEQHAA